METSKETMSRAKRAETLPRVADYQSFLGLVPPLQVSPMGDATNVVTEEACGYQ